ncbi:hypothetical protein BY458DRAFT_494519 [Sporodiniella umbellata]|nr:hypothetical protein BY458DRAFT_494519 [Sporodiniella umbellata]
MLYCEPYNKARAIKRLKGISNINIDVGYKDAPVKLFLILIQYRTILEAVEKDVVVFLPRHQKSLKKVEETGYKVVGYIRKSKGKENGTRRIFFLSLMLVKLKTRLLADKVFVSPNSSVGSPFNQRDEQKRKTSKDDVLLTCRWRHSGEKKIMLVAIDHAGLTTNYEDLKSFLSTYSSVKEVAID